MISDLLSRSRHEILCLSPNASLRLQWTKKGNRAYSTLPVFRVCKMSWVLAVMLLFIIPLFLRAPPLPFQCVMTVSLLEHAAMVKRMLADRLKGLYCSEMYGSDKGSVREVLLTGLSVVTEEAPFGMQHWHNLDNSGEWNHFKSSVLTLPPRTPCQRPTKDQATSAAAPAWPTSILWLMRWFVVVDVNKTPVYELGYSPKFC